VLELRSELARFSERAVLFMGGASFKFIFWASFRIVGFLNVFCPGVVTPQP